MKVRTKDKRYFKMGAETDYRILDGKLSVPELRKAWSAEVQEALYEHGHGGYTGTIAEDNGDPIKVKEHVLVQSIDDAHEWLNDNAEKWKASIAIKAIGYDEEVKWVVGGCYSC